MIPLLAHKDKHELQGDAHPPSAQSWGSRRARAGPVSVFSCVPVCARRCVRAAPACAHTGAYHTGDRSADAGDVASPTYFIMGSAAPRHDPFLHFNFTLPSVAVESHQWTAGRTDGLAGDVTSLQGLPDSPGQVGLFQAHVLHTEEVVSLSVCLAHPCCQHPAPHQERPPRPVLRAAVIPLGVQGRGAGGASSRAVASIYTGIV